MKLTALNTKEIAKLAPNINEITHYNVVVKSQCFLPVSVYFDGKNYFAAKGKLFNVRQNHKVEVKGSLSKISQYLIGLSNESEN